ncbi:MAG TPA: murein L,D-transpeptidase catalytic domain family protein [Flavisolibacter sp.]|nr:murein L,D-transpeptidase catalytic domain family protein [Flavisolibacter sp.]
MRKAYIPIGFFVLLIVSALAWLGYTQSGKKFRALHLPKANAPSGLAKPGYISKLREKKEAALSFATSKDLNTAFCFLIDMSLSSGQERFFVYSFKKDTILHSGLVTHGRCNEEWLEGRRYSNAVGSGCTSLGRYKTGYAYSGSFGLAFKLHGLEKTNSKAFERYVVLHSHECVPEEETGSDICQSDGCPTVSPGFLKKIEPLIKRSGKPVLLWIFE